MKADCNTFNWKGISVILGVIISLGVILTWKMDAAIGQVSNDIRAQVAQNYVSKELLDAKLDTVNAKLNAIAQAVGARVKDKY